MKLLEYELELTSRVVLASEDWAEGYARAPVQHAELIKLTARMERQVIAYLRDLARKAPNLINWYHYSAAIFEQQRLMGLKASHIEAYDVKVIINNDAVSQQDQEFIKVVFKTVSEVMALGAQSMSVEHSSVYPVHIGLSSTSEIMQRLTTKQLANLVGMKVQKDGTIIPNPKPEFNIDETTRGKIAQSVKTSISLGEDHIQAVKRLETVIADPDRADMIARTETVGAYATGRAEYARQSGASGKYWTDSGAIDVCADNTAQGTIPIDANFIGGVDSEPQHPRCKCQVVYAYGDSIDDALS